MCAEPMSCPLLFIMGGRCHAGRLATAQVQAMCFSSLGGWDMGSSCSVHRPRPSLGAAKHCQGSGLLALHEIVCAALPVLPYMPVVGRVDMGDALVLGWCSSTLYNACADVAWFSDGEHWWSVGLADASDFGMNSVLVDPYSSCGDL